MLSAEEDVAPSGKNKTINGNTIIIRNKRKPRENNKNAKVLQRMC